MPSWNVSVQDLIMNYLHATADWGGPLKGMNSKKDAV